MSFDLMWMAWVNSTINGSVFAFFLLFGIDFYEAFYDYINNDHLSISCQDNFVAEDDNVDNELETRKTRYVVSTPRW